MKAVILCAGCGERLRPLTNVLPKPLFPILGQPLLENIIYHLKKFGVNEICINTHWLADKIAHYIEDSSNFGVKAHISYEPQILGVAGGIGTMRDFLKDEELFIVHNGDILTNLDPKPAIDFHRKEHPLVTLILHNYKTFNNVIVSGNEILDIGNQLYTRKALGPFSTNLAFTGVSIMDPDIFDFLPYKKPCPINQIYIELIKSHPGSLKGYVSDLFPIYRNREAHYWKDIGTLESYLDVHRDILVKRINVLSSQFIGTRGNIYISNNSTVSPLTKLAGFVSVGENCIIEEGVELENCILWDNVIVRKGEKTKNKVFYR